MFFFFAFLALLAISMCCGTHPTSFLSAANYSLDANKIPLWNACRELYEGMPGDEVRAVIKKYELQKQHWAAAGDGKVFEWWRWNISERDEETGAVRAYASLDIELRQNILATFTCYAYGSKDLLGHRCIFGTSKCPHFQNTAPPSPAPTPAPERKVIWEK